MRIPSHRDGYPLTELKYTMRIPSHRANTKHKVRRPNYRRTEINDRRTYNRCRTAAPQLQSAHVLKETRIAI